MKLKEQKINNKEFKRSAKHIKFISTITQGILYANLQNNVLTSLHELTKKHYRRFTLLQDCEKVSASILFILYIFEIRMSWFEKNQKIN